MRFTVLHVFFFVWVCVMWMRGEMIKKWTSDWVSWILDPPVMACLTQKAGPAEAAKKCLNTGHHVCMGEEVVMLACIMSQRLTASNLCGETWTLHTHTQTRRLAVKIGQQWWLTSSHFFFDCLLQFFYPSPLALGMMKIRWYLDWKSKGLKKIHTRSRMFAWKSRTSFVRLRGMSVSHLHTRCFHPFIVCWQSQSFPLTFFFLVAQCDPGKKLETVSLFLIAWQERGNQRGN